MIVQSQAGPFATDFEIVGNDGNVEMFIESLFGIWFPMNVMWDERDNLWMFSNDFGLVYYAKVIDPHAPPCDIPAFIEPNQWVQCSPSAEVPPQKR